MYTFIKSYISSVGNGITYFIGEIEFKILVLYLYCKQINKIKRWNKVFNIFFFFWRKVFNKNKIVGIALINKRSVSHHVGPCHEFNQCNSILIIYDIREYQFHRYYCILEIGKNAHTHPGWRLKREEYWLD